MNKIAVIYKSKYGATKKYAEWIAEALSAELLEASSIKGETLMDYDVVIYGGGLYAGTINGVKLVTNNPTKSLVVFAVGLADPDTTDFSAILTNNFTSAQLPKIKAFLLRGAISYDKLGFAHKCMMGILKKAMAKKDLSQMSGEEKAIAETRGEDVDFTCRDSIKPLVEYVRSMM